MSPHLSTMMRMDSTEAARAKTGDRGKEGDAEALKLRRLQIMIAMVVSVLSQDQDLTVEEAAEIIANSRRAALAMFPGKELAFDILYRPRLQRVLNERFRLQ